MDYCSSCRRHLNGALACPGCGAYAPDIAPRATPAPVTTGAAAWQAPADSAWHDDPDAYAEEHAEDPYDGPDTAVAASPLGRAARRRQRARWKKNQRRAVVATAVALVGGGLTVASLDRQSTDRAQAATAPDNTAMGVAGEQATEPTLAVSTPTGRHRAPDSTPAARTAAVNAPHEQTAGTPRVTSTPRQNTGASARPTATSAAQPQSAATTSATTTAAQSQPTATPTATTGTGTSPSTATATASPAPTATAPSQLCLLVVCLG
ncbi:hypothetical protein ACFV2H_15415 [Streptomyces sp. NPDC059629]|uniref:SCO2400 family protein n=1 Tax=Streptomyces sp. NPDC059629 TaxID=3346889 RepID=UPI0036C7419D